MCKNNVKKKEESDATKEKNDCKGCQLCKILNKSDSIMNQKKGLTLEVKPGGTCKSTGVVYAIICKKKVSIIVRGTRGIQ